MLRVGGGSRSPEHDIAKNVDTTRLEETSGCRSFVVKLRCRSNRAIIRHRNVQQYETEYWELVLAGMVYI